MGNMRGKKPSGDFVDVFQILALLWDRKWLISIFTVSVAVLAAVLSLFLPNIYRAEALVAPKTSSDMSDIGRMLSSNIGFASLAGLTGNSLASEETELAIATLKSKAFIWHFIKSRNLLVPLMATKSWDTKSDSLVIDDSIYDTESKVWIRDVAPPRSSEPSQLEAYEAFRSILNIERNKITGLVTISIEFYSPKEAQQ